MSTRFKSLILLMMTLALSFGYFNLYYPIGGYDYARLHIFLFNLCSGGTILLYFSEPHRHPSLKVRFFLALTLAYAVSAFFNVYIPVLLISPLLVAIVETVRIRRFSFFPWDFFKSDAPVSAKFHHAALLCLSIGLVIAALVIVNNEYLQVISISKLNLNIFFLGYSFPLSLITMSLIFAIMDENGRHIRMLKNLAFWSINLGVITFFIFILAGLYFPQVMVTLVLFFTVLIIFHMFANLGRELQQKKFLISGMVFLMMTAITGILYIMLEFSADYNATELTWLMQLHAFASLYGWNLCGLAIICRHDDFPIRLHSTSLILLHWVTVMVMATLGCYYPPLAALTVICYSAFLFFMLFSRPTHKILVK